MSREFSERRQEVVTSQRFEIVLSSEKDCAMLETWLSTLIGTEAAEQCVFAMRSTVQKDFTNHCKDATQELGKALAERFGGEESFFDVVPGASFSDVRSYAPLDKTRYRGDYHSVGLLELVSQHKESFCLIVDLTFYTVSPDVKKNGVLVASTPGGHGEALKMLENEYGGSWKVEFKFNPQKNNFEFEG